MLKLHSNAWRSEPAVWVTVHRARRARCRATPATWMAVFADGVVGTIGGGHVEFQAIAHARAMLAGQPLRARAAICAGAEPGPVLRRRHASGVRAGGCGNRWPMLRQRLATALVAGGAVWWRPCRPGAGRRAGPAAVCRDAGSTAATRSFRPGCRPTWRASIPTRCRAPWPRLAPGSQRADHELQPCRGSGRRGRVPAPDARDGTICPMSA